MTDQSPAAGLIARLFSVFSIATARARGFFAAQLFADGGARLRRQELAHVTVGALIEAF